MKETSESEEAEEMEKEREELLHVCLNLQSALRGNWSSGLAAAADVDELLLRKEECVDLQVSMKDDMQQTTAV